MASDMYGTGFWESGEYIYTRRENGSWEEKERVPETAKKKKLGYSLLYHILSS